MTIYVYTVGENYICTHAMCTLNEKYLFCTMKILILLLV